MKTQVKDILAAKGDQVWAVSPDDTVLDALKTMKEHDIGAVLVMDGDALRGILSERDYARKVVLLGRASRNTPVKEIMTAEVETVSPEDSIDQCMTSMTEKHIRHLPVVEEGRVVGVISIGDVVKAIIEEQAFLLDQMEAYITGQPA
ncbi:MAG TPA: CBS domain-containing protein [Anaerolineae bacterium]|nr:CBS domain-containing protein [Caldilineae bacterium]HID35132.1 CBS domain-containing protein [Anaerolineae bacterium]HIQ11753.1 CBS domain-containing protein [Caldilineales bacterium]